MPRLPEWSATVEALAWVLLALQAGYALADGIHPSPAVRWALVAALLPAPVLLRLARVRGPRTLGLVALALLWVPVAWTWPTAALSLGGIAVVGLLLVASVAVAAAFARGRRPATPD